MGAHAIISPVAASSGEVKAATPGCPSSPPMYSGGLLPHAIAALPSGENIHEIWCGSEYTVVCTKTGLLWASGWNEHGNLGIGSDIDISFCWQPVVSVSTEQFPPITTLNEGELAGQHCSSSREHCTGGSTPHHCQLANAWDGAMACGGGHCIALLQNEK